MVLGSATPSLESRYNAAARQIHAARTARTASQTRPMPTVRADRHAPGVSRNAQAAIFSRELHRRHSASAWKTASRPCPAQPPRIFHLRRLPRLRRARRSASTARVTLTYHRRDRRLLCHYCGYAEKVPIGLPQMRERAHLLSGRRVGARGRRAARRISRQRASRGSIATPSPASANTKTSCKNFREAQFRHSGGHADDRQRARHPERDAGGRGVGGCRARHAGFSRRRAHLPDPDAGGGTRRTRRSARHRSACRPSIPIITRSASPPRRITQASSKRNCSSAA